tara:strand:- start:19245 stop:20501 length:1257 start_codon:yes stop_codon:yes gene_type:complete
MDTDNIPTRDDQTDPSPTLHRAVGLPLLVLYGLGITIGAGIYVLIGVAAQEAGQYAPFAFLFAAFVMGFSALSFAELSGRIPQSAGEAVYVDAGFGWNWLTLITGLLIIFSATIAGAAIGLGSAGYMATIVPLPQTVIVAIIILLMGAVASMEVKNSVMFAGILTVVEILGLGAIVVAGFANDPAILKQLPTSIPSLTDTAAFIGVLNASLIAFFAFIGFDDVVNLVEETHNPKRTMPLAIIISLIAVTVIYFLVVFVAVQSVPIERLSQSTAPIGVLFEELTGLSPLGITLIAIVATINGVVIEIIMASRVVYGLAKKGRLPKSLAKVNAHTRVPLNATLVITAVMLVAAVFVPLNDLVEWTSLIILFVFTLVNASLIIIKLRGDLPPKDIFTVPLIFPILGVFTCLFLLFGPWILG